MAALSGMSALVRGPLLPNLESRFGLCFDVIRGLPSSVVTFVLLGFPPQGLEGDLQPPLLTGSV